jgi:nitrite reductase/ring-hydroxylating ferredoxin subunit
MQIAPNDNWHPVGLSSSIEAGSSAGTHLFGRELVVWRDIAGVAHISEDRCPHRGMKLSFGFVRGDRIACLYHGWQFDRGGYCRYIPAHPDLDVPNTIKVPVYPAHERGNMIWTTLSDHPPALPEELEPSFSLRSIYADSDIEAVVETLEDSRLLPFASEESVEIVLKRMTETLYMLSSGEDSLMVGIQQISRARIGLHLTCRLAKHQENSMQRHLLGWSLRLRYAIEHAGLLDSAGRSATERA